MTKKSISTCNKIILKQIIGQFSEEKTKQNI